MTQEFDDIAHSTFFNQVCHKVFGSRQGGAKIVIDAEDAELGAGKTSAAVFLARLFSRAFDYELQTEDFTLSAAEYIKRYRDHPGPEQPSVIGLDETVAAGAGDARRSMSNSNLDLASAWQMMRMKRVVTIGTLAHWSDLDKRLKRLSDYRLNCRVTPIGHFRPYKVKVGFDDGKVRTKKLDSAIHFPDMADDPYYERITEEKDELMHATTWDADDMMDEEGSEDGEDSVGPKEIAEEIIDEGDLDQYVSTHPSNKTQYVDKDMIQLEFELSEGDSRKVQKLLRRERNGAQAAQAD